MRINSRAHITALSLQIARSGQSFSPGGSPLPPRQRTTNIDMLLHSVHGQLSVLQRRERDIRRQRILELYHLGGYSKNRDVSCYMCVVVRVVDLYYCVFIKRLYLACLVYTVLSSRERGFGVGWSSELFHVLGCIHRGRDGRYTFIYTYCTWSIGGRDYCSMVWTTTFGGQVSVAAVQFEAVGTEVSSCCRPWWSCVQV